MSGGRALAGRSPLGLVTDTGVPAGFSGWSWTTGLMRSSRPTSRFASGQSGCRRAGASGASMGETTSRAATRPRASMTAIPCSQRVPIRLSPASTLSRFARSGSCLPRARNRHTEPGFDRGERPRSGFVHDQPPLRPVRPDPERRIVAAARGRADPSLYPVRSPAWGPARDPCPVRRSGESAASPARRRCPQPGRCGVRSCPCCGGGWATVQRFRLTSTAV